MQNTYQKGVEAVNQSQRIISKDIINVYVWPFTNVNVYVRNVTNLIVVI